MGQKGRRLKMFREIILGATDRFFYIILNSLPD